MIRIVILEDEPLAAQRLTQMINDLEVECQVVQVMDTVTEAIEFFRNNSDDYDIVLMDVQLADGNSFLIFSETEINKPVIFTTAYDEFVFQAFKNLAVDYLLKPVKKEELAEAINKYLRHFRQLEKDSGSSDWFVFKIGNILKTIRQEEILFIVSINKISYLIMRDGQKSPVDMPLDDIIGKLKAHEFFKANRQYIVSRPAIQKISIVSKSRIMLTLKCAEDHAVIVSSERSRMFKLWLNS
jgi:DNA-binding LytR/AlgR family response regulator